MSRIITNTNIIVDDFDFCKSFPKHTFHHFLTHFHSDHYEGLSPLWDYGHIHCTHQTKKYLLDKYPKLTNLHSYSYGTPFTLPIVPDAIHVDVTFFDAKHIPGAAMILFRGHMGTVLFTGDFRYEYAMVTENPLLFPPRLREGQCKQEEVEQMRGIAVKVDEMVFDNTYCNKAFQFETEPAIVEKMAAIIQKNQHKKLIFIAMGALGKHRILMKICERFQTLVVVSEKQMRKVALANLRTDFLTTNASEGYIHLISKKNRAEIVAKTKKGPLGDSFICIDTDFLMLDHQSPDQINYIVPYSLHSNYAEMATFIRMVEPCVLRKVVLPYANFKQVKLRLKVDFRLKFAKYLDFLERELHHSDSGYSFLVREYTCIHELSKTYLQWFKPEEQRRLMLALGLGDGSQDHNLRKRKPVLLSDEEMSNGLSRGKKTSLKDIADQLNAVHKNRTIQAAFTKDPERLNTRHFNSIFNSDNEHSISRTFCTTAKIDKSTEQSETSNDLTLKK
jgi:DNA cross-link repair 1B protein